MNPLTDPFTFSVPLALTAHSQAEQFRRQHRQPQQAKQVYLNTLAVYAVNFYLETVGFDTDLGSSGSWNPAIQTLMTPADLVVRNYGRLECCPVLPDATLVQISPQVWGDRIGYVIVELTASLREARLLGFVHQVSTETLALKQLQPLDSLTEHLRQFQQPQAVSTPINLSQWFQNVVDAGWQTIDSLVNPFQASVQPAFSFRSGSSQVIPERSPSVIRWRPFSLGQAPGYSNLALTIGLFPLSELETEIWVQVAPVLEQAKLPADLQVFVLDDAGAEVIQAQADNAEAIQIQFSGEPGEPFSLRIVDQHTSLTEVFVI